MANKATLEWKLKTKLESVGIAALCLACDKSYDNPVMNGCKFDFKKNFGFDIFIFKRGHFRSFLFIFYNQNGSQDT